jgi:hypothetical protein
MTDLRGRRELGRILVVAAVGLAALLSALPPALGAEDTTRPAGSLSLVPAKAAFYTTILRGREQIEAIAKSRAWAKLMDMPVTKMGLELWKKEFSEEGKLAFLYKLYQMPENKQLLELLGEMFSDEVFCYGGEGWDGITRTAQQLMGGAYFGRLFTAGVRWQAGNAGELQARILLEILAENANSLRVPDLIIGFKLKTKDRATAQIKRLEGFLKGLAMQVPQLKDAVKREKIGTASFLVVALNGSMVPWDHIPIKSLEEKEGQFDALLKKLKELKLTLAVGIRDDYLLVSLGESTAPLQDLGKDKLLADSDEFKPLAKFADKRLTSIGYISPSLNKVVSTGQETADNLVAMIKGFIPKDSLNEQQIAQIDKDLKELAKDMKKFLPHPGAAMSFSFLNGRGYESYQYDWTKYPQQDGSKPLSLLNHVGGDPIFATVGRSKGSAAQYQFLVKWLKIGYGYVDQYALPLLPPQVKESYDQWTKKAFPILKKLDTVTATMLLPALKDGQIGFVLDARIKSKQWIQLLPETDKELPMIEPALLLGVSDAELFRKTLSEYRSLANLFLASLLDLAPGQVPELKIPKPTVKKVAGGEVYFYQFPDAWGIDKQIVPNGGVGEKVAVFTISMEQSKRLLASSPLKVKGGPLADSKRALASATYFNFAGLMDAASPWIDLAVQKLVPVFTGGDDETEGILKQVRTVVEVLKVFRSYASVTYVEEGVSVSHSEMIIHDIPAEK